MHLCVSSSQPKNIHNSNGKSPESNITCVGKFAQDMAYALQAERKVPLQWAVLPTTLSGGTLKPFTLLIAMHSHEGKRLPSLQ